MTKLQLATSIINCTLLDHNLINPVFQICSILISRYSILSTSFFIRLLVTVELRFPGAPQKLALAVNTAKEQYSCLRPVRIPHQWGSSLPVLSGLVGLFVPPSTLSKCFRHICLQMALCQVSPLCTRNIFHLQNERKGTLTKN